MIQWSDFISSCHMRRRPFYTRFYGTFYQLKWKSEFAIYDTLAIFMQMGV
jgi:hypothetical protein